MNPKCIHRNERAECQAYAQRNSDYCVVHDPAQADKMAEARKRGGSNSRRKWRGLPNVQPPKTVEDAQRMRGEIVAGLLRGDIDPDAAATAEEMLQEWLRTQELIQANQARSAREVAAMTELIRAIAESKREEASRDKEWTDSTAHFDPEYKEKAMETPQQTDPRLEQMTAVGPPLPLRPIPPSRWRPIQNTPPEDLPEYAGASTVAGISDAA